MPAFPALRSVEVDVPKNLPFWCPGAYAARRPYLLARGRTAAALRAWFAKRNFVEVETAALQVSPGNEIHLHAFATDLIGPSGEHR
jgi:lysyl-tRNA synthetase class 2